MIKRITEIGVAVKDLVVAGDRLQEILSARAGSVLNSPEYEMNGQMFRMGNIEFELMQPANQRGIIAQFLKRRGEGLHHLAFEVEDIAETIAWMKKHDVKLINERPVIVDDLKAVFIHPESLGGVLIELIEGTAKHVNNEPLPWELQTQSHSEGVGVEGILEVGILVRALEATSVLYSEIFSSETSELVGLKHFSFRMRICRIGNVDLKLIEITKSNDYLRVLFQKKQAGLSHITLKVRNIQKAITYLQQKEVSFVEEPLTDFYESKWIFVDPKEMSNIPIILKR